MTENITLYYREGSSDKVYQAAIEPRGHLYAVTFAYGRRGSTLNTGTKTQSPIGYQDAKAIYDKLVREKTAKGYTPGESGTPYQDNGNARKPSGILPQLLNTVEEPQVASLINDPAWWMQEKLDGRRLLLQKQEDRITGINKLGLIVALPSNLIESASAAPCDLVLDGEAIGDTLHVFDALVIDGEEIGGLRYGERYLRLMNLLASFQHPHISLVPTAFQAADKRALFDQLKAKQREGVVFKHTDAPCIAGRPASGGSQLKFKFIETASFIVGKVNAKRSVALVLLDEGKPRPAGNVTIPPNHSIPETDAVVECRYLYAIRQSGCIYQPVYLGTRDDIPQDECTTGQLKFKPDTGAEQAA